jgi:hypothetical protein
MENRMSKSRDHTRKRSATLQESTITFFREAKVRPRLVKTTRVTKDLDKRMNPDGHRYMPHDIYFIFEGFKRDQIEIEKRMQERARQKMIKMSMKGKK